jgi:hypothetical protein
MQFCKKSTTLTAMLIIGLLTIGLAGVRAEDPYDVTSARGKLTVADPQSDTVMVEVPMNGKQLTVGGELVPNANVTKNGSMAELKDFEVDRPVTVKWMTTDKGINILELHQK